MANEYSSNMVHLCLRRVRAAATAGMAAIVLIIPLTPPYAAAAETTPSVQRRTLPSGLQVIVAEQPGKALVALDLRVRVGSSRETAATNGTAHFIEHLVFKGTETRGRGEIDRAIETMGGEVTAQTSRDATRFATVLTAANWQAALIIMADMTLHPAFRPNDVTAEKKVILNEMAIARTETTRRGFNALAEITFAPDDPYRLPLLGTEATVNAMTPESLKDFWRQWYRPENMVLAVAGKVTAADVFAAAEQLFPPSAEPRAASVLGSASPSAAAADLPAVRSAITDPNGGELTTLFFGFRAPAAGEPDAAVAAGVVSLLADRVDGGSGDGRLAEALIKRRRLAVSVTADYVAQTGTSLILIAAVGRRTDAAKLEQALIEELRTIPVTGFTEKDAAEARQNLRAAQERGGSVEGTASRLALAEVLRLPQKETDDPAAYAARLERVITPGSLTTAAHQYLAPEYASIVILNAPPPAPAAP